MVHSAVWQGSDGVLPDDGVSRRNMQELFNVNFNANLNWVVRLSNCASVGGKNFDKYRDLCL